MSAPRVYVDVGLAVGVELALPESAMRHVVQVLRRRVGDAVVLFNGDGRDYRATLTAAERRRATVRVDVCTAAAAESPLRVTLLQGVSKGERMDWVMQKSVELGAYRLVPVITERTVVRVDDARSDKKLAHWRGVVQSAAEQSGRAVLPEVAEPVALGEALTGVVGVVLDPAAPLGIGDYAPGGDDVAVLIGPEGGLSEAEIAQAERAGFTRVRLGPRVLRTETAALAVLAVLQARFGDLAR